MQEAAFNPSVKRVGLAFGFGVPAHFFQAAQDVSNSSSMLT
jgi:hypothetical protein